MQLIKKKKRKNRISLLKEGLACFSAMKRNLRTTLQSGYVMWPFVTFDIFHLLTAEQ